MITWVFIGPIISTYKRIVDNESIIEVSLGKEEEEVDIDTAGPVYNNIQCVINKENSFHCGEIYQMFTNQNFP
jgi:hypothetical protein